MWASCGELGQLQACLVRVVLHLAVDQRQACGRRAAHRGRLHRGGDRDTATKLADRVGVNDDAGRRLRHRHLLERLYAVDAGTADEQDAAAAGQGLMVKAKFPVKKTSLWTFENNN